LSMVRNGSTVILVTTDLAGRGLDIPKIENVVHYHLPNDEETFIHRNGRTARMNESGNVFLLINSKDALPEYMDSIPELNNLEKMEVNEIKIPWVTLLINKGKKDKIRKFDVVGFLSKIGLLNRNELGLVEVKESYTLAGVNANKAQEVIKLTNGHKIKGKKAIVSLLNT